MAKEVVVAITDAGGRGAALAEAYARSPHVDTILGLPGKEVWKLNTYGKPVITFPGLTITDTESIVDICQGYDVALLDVCQDNWVEAGLVDAARENGLRVVGPTRAAGKIEWSKIYARELGDKMAINQPKFRAWYSREAALNFYRDYPPNEPLFVKADGLAAGKGTIGTRNEKGNKEELIQAIRSMEQFGDAGKRFLVEEWLKNDDGTAGEEFSYFVLCNGEEFIYLDSANDDKDLGGLQTGGLGGNNQPYILNRDFRTQIEHEAIAPILKGLVEENHPYSGVLYYSGMRLFRGGRYHSACIEFNARWGDPEAQIVLPGIKNDWFEVMMTLAEGGSLKNIKIENNGLKRVGVVVASLGYPGDYSAVKGKEIIGIEDVRKMDRVRLYGAGVDYDGQTYRANGGRLLTIVGEGEDVVKARKKAYAGVSHIIVGDNEQVYKPDIAWREVKRFYQNRK